MASTPFRRAVLAALERRALREMSERSAVRYAECFLAFGGTIQLLADSLIAEMIVPSRAFVSFALHRSSRDASARIMRARKASRSGKTAGFVRPIALCRVREAGRPSQEQIVQKTVQ